MTAKTITVTALRQALIEAVKNGENVRYYVQDSCVTENFSRSKTIEVGLAIAKIKLGNGMTFWYNEWYEFDTENPDEVTRVWDTEFCDGVWGVEDVDLNRVTVLGDDGEEVERSISHPSEYGFPEQCYEIDYKNIKGEFENQGK